MLYACYDLVEKDEDFRVVLMKIKDRYDTIIDVYKRQACDGLKKKHKK